MKLIDKSTLVAEIKRRIKTNKECMLGLRNLDYYQGKVDALNDIISFLDTIEVKEVDLEKYKREINIIIDILDREEHNGHLSRQDLKDCVLFLKLLQKLL